MLQASEARADRLRQDVAAAGDEQITGVERFEVAIIEIPAAARA